MQGNKVEVSNCNNNKKCDKKFIACFTVKSKNCHSGLKNTSVILEC